MELVLHRDDSSLLDTHPAKNSSLTNNVYHARKAQSDLIMDRTVNQLAMTVALIAPIATMIVALIATIAMIVALIATIAMTVARTTTLALHEALRIVGMILLYQIRISVIRITRTSEKRQFL